MYVTAAFQCWPSYYIAAGIASPHGGKPQTDNMQDHEGVPHQNKQSLAATATYHLKETEMDIRHPPYNSLH
jgi:hypothetical protein